MSLKMEVRRDLRRIIGEMDGLIYKMEDFSIGGEGDTDDFVHGIHYIQDYLEKFLKRTDNMKIVANHLYEDQN